jgi:hypothetical protein
MSATPLLQLRRIVKSYGGVRALRGVDFELQAGEVHALLGENGAGKSTLIKTITGAHQPTSGSIAIAGQPVANLTPTTARQLGIACIYQQPALSPTSRSPKTSRFAWSPPRACAGSIGGSAMTAPELCWRDSAPPSRPSPRCAPCRCRSSSSSRSPARSAPAPAS